jgi:hypothetical protein
MARLINKTQTGARVFPSFKLGPFLDIEGWNLELPLSQLTKKSGDDRFRSPPRRAN